MPVHDWTKVDDGALHDFHTRWITHLTESLNDGLLPVGYYAMCEQHGGRIIADILTLQAPLPPAASPGEGGIAVAETPPRVRRKVSFAGAARAMRRTLTIRHKSGHPIVALVEVVSPANKDRPSHVEEFVDKAVGALERGVHVVLVDLILPGPHDPQGMHAAISDRFDDEPHRLPPGEPLTLASYVAERPPYAYLENLSLGTVLVDMPLFLNPDRYIYLPLERTYQSAYRVTPAVWRQVLEGSA